MIAHGSAAARSIRFDEDNGACPAPVHLDGQLMVFNKPAGLLAVPGRGVDKQDCLASRVARAWPEARVVHRLDMATSGLMVFARSAAMQAALGTLFANGAIDKTYTAMVHGKPLMSPPSTPVGDGGGTWSLIDLPIAADWPRRPLQVIAPEGRPSQTLWRIADEADAAPCSAALRSGWPVHTRLLLRPLTGRTHQLRVHLRAIGHPILGDALYADGADTAGANGTPAAPVDRLMLHATRLSFIHPSTQARLDLHSPCPF